MDLRWGSVPAWTPRRLSGERSEIIVSFRWATDDHRCHLAQSPEPNIWKEYPNQLLNDDAYAAPLGFVIIYYLFSRVMLYREVRW